MVAPVMVPPAVVIVAETKRLLEAHCALAAGVTELITTVGAGDIPANSHAPTSGVLLDPGRVAPL